MTIQEQILFLQQKIAEKGDPKDKMDVFLVEHWRKEQEKLKVIISHKKY